MIILAKDVFALSTVRAGGDLTGEWKQREREQWEKAEHTELCVRVCVWAHTCVQKTAEKLREKIVNFVTVTHLILLTHPYPTLTQGYYTGAKTWKVKKPIMESLPLEEIVKSPTRRNTKLLELSTEPEQFFQAMLQMQAEDRQLLCGLLQRGPGQPPCPTSR